MKKGIYKRMPFFFWPVMSTVELSIVLPCLNEARTVVDCVSAAKRYLAANKVSGEVIVADNGSDDGSQGLAVDAGARLVTVHYRGYGAALQGGIAAAQGRFVVMADADQSYDLASLNAFLEKLREGYDLVMGNRFKGGIRSGAMPLLHRYLGNPALSFIGKLFFKSTVGDFHCGLRGFRKDAIVNLNLRANGMEFASEMVVKAALAKLRITEVPTTLSKDGRNRAPHLRTWRDGWRHLRFLLLFSPRWLFLYPGAMLLTLGTSLQVVLLHGAFVIGS
ncbi:MAG TPA: glycosyltransferase family 2 protein, partial [Steroidobacteraceae bacterium]|nr:glycosyltransferase family 2 protein [Steroidobacteraceae bacterium]